MYPPAVREQRRVRGTSSLAAVSAATAVVVVVSAAVLRLCVYVCTCVRTGSRGEARGERRRAQPAAAATNGWIIRDKEEIPRDLTRASAARGPRHRDREGTKTPRGGEEHPAGHGCMRARLCPRRHAAMVSDSFPPSFFFRIRRQLRSYDREA